MKSIKAHIPILGKGFQNTTIIALGLSFEKVAAFVALPFLTRSLAVESYGKLELLLVIYILFRVCSSLNLIQAVSRFSGEYRKSGDENVFLSTISSIVLLNSAIAALAFLGLSAVLDIKLASLSIVIPWLVASSLRDFGSAYLKFSGKVVLSALESVLNATLLTSTTIWLHFHDQLSVSSFLIAKTLIAAVSTLAISIKLRPSRFRFDVSIAKIMLGYSIPFAASSLFLVGFQYIDRFMISNILSIEDVGIYSLAMKIGSVFMIFSSSVSASIGPIIYTNYKNAETPARIRKYFLFYNLAGVLLGLLITGLAAGVFSTELLPPQYKDAFQYVPLICLTLIINGYNVFFPGLNIKSKTTTLMLVNASGLVAIVLLNVLLIPAFGVKGALYSTLLSLTATQLAIHRLAQSHYPLRLPVLRIAGSIFLLFLFVDWTIG